jgi:integrase
MNAGLTVEELAGPLFVTKTGARIDRHAVFRLVRRLAERAGISAFAQLSPHSLRHAFATTARAEGVALEDVQDAMGHADPRTTRRYDRDRHNLDRDPSYAIWAARARRGGRASDNRADDRTGQADRVQTRRAGRETRPARPGKPDTR